MYEADKLMKITTVLKKFFLYTAHVLLILCAASAIGLAFREMNFPETNIAIVYVLAVLLTTLIVPGYMFGFLSSILSSFAFNFLFTEPYFTFTANAPSYIITFIIMTITSFTTSSLISHSKLSERQAQKSEAETKALYELTNLLTDAIDIHDIASIAADTISSVICKNSGCLCYDENGLPEKTFIQQISPKRQIRRDVKNPDNLMHRIEALRTAFYIGDEFYDFPIHGKEMILGVLRLPSENAQFLSKSQNSLLHSMIESIALAMDRFRSAQQRIKLREETEQERYRSNLLRSISHDLRTPLSGILGTAEMLLDMTPKEDKRYDLIEGIMKDAGWLHSLVENILNLTRLQDGKLIINKQLEAVEEVLGSSIAHILRRYPEYDIAVHAPDELLLVPMDVKLISQVLINLLNNAIKYTEPSGEISVNVSENKELNQAVFSIKDAGCGIYKSDLPHIFKTFYTSESQHSDARPGVGLGLAICDAIIKAHGGIITARNRTDAHGAEFIFTLPLGGK